MPNPSPGMGSKIAEERSSDRWRGRRSRPSPEDEGRRLCEVTTFSQQVGHLTRQYNRLVWWCVDLMVIVTLFPHSESCRQSSVCLPALLISSFNIA